MHEIDIDEPDAAALTSPFLPAPPDHGASSRPAPQPRGPRLEEAVWSSPIVVRSSESTSSLFHSAYDFLADEDGYVRSRGRKRTLFGRQSGEWRFSEEMDISLTLSSQSENSTMSEGARSPPSRSPTQLNATSESPRTEIPQTRFEDDQVILSGSTETAKEGLSSFSPKGTDQSLRRSSDLDPSQRISPDGAHRSRPTSRLETPSKEHKTRMLSIPKTPLSPHLAPVESQGLPLVSPLLTTEMELNQDRFDSVHAQNSSESVQVEALQAPKETHASFPPDFGLDGSYLSRAQVDTNVCDVGEEVGNSQLLFGTVTSPNSSFKNGFEQNEEATSHPQEGKQSAQSSEQSDSVIYTSNTQLLRQIANEGQQHEVIPSSSQEKTAAHQPKRNRDGDIGGWKARDVFDEFLKQSPTEAQCSTAQQHAVKVEQQGLELSPDPRKGSIEGTRNDPEELQDVPKDRHLDERTPPASQNQDVQQLSTHSPFVHRVDEILNKPFPPTPARTRSDLEEMLPDTHRLRAPGQTDRPKRPTKKVEEEADPKTVQETSATAEVKRNERHDARPQRRSSRIRSRDVPDVISPWFGPRRSTRRKSRPTEDVVKTPKSPIATTIEKSKHDRTISKPIAATAGTLRKNAARVSEDAAAGDTQTRRRERYSESSPSVFKTPLAIYQPLSALDRYLGPSDSQGPRPIDVFGVVTSPTSEAAKPKAGPKDWNVILHMSDRSLHPQTVQVQCFRPFASSLPRADVGDVVLLRDFVVKIRTRQYFLLSAGTSGWLIWRYAKPDHDSESSLSQHNLSDAADRSQPGNQECRGPPVECGQEEQEHAHQLRQWWIQLQGKDEQ